MKRRQSIFPPMFTFTDFNTRHIMRLNHPILESLAKRLNTKLSRGTIANAADWAMRYRLIDSMDVGHANYNKWMAADPVARRMIHVPKKSSKFRFEKHPWSLEMHTCSEEFIVGQKSSQMAFTEVCMNRAFYANDILGETVLYILPSQDSASDFSNGRFEPALEASAHLRNLYSDVKNVGLKRAGGASLYIRGANSRTGLKSIPAAKLFADETDEMDTTKLVLAFERMAGQDNAQCFLISTPSYDNCGINYFFKDSTQDHFFFRCPHCSKFIEMVFNLKDEKASSLVITCDDPTNKLILESFYKCTECQGVLSHDDKISYLNLDNSQWVAKHSDRVMRGFHINQFNSHAKAASPSNMAITFLRSLASPEEETEFYNNKLGLTHAVSGAKITDEQLTECVGTHTMMETSSGNHIVTMGIDPGHNKHYYEICEYIIDGQSEIRDINLMSKARMIKCGFTDSFDYFEQLFVQYNVTFAVIDAQPQVTLSKRFCQKFQGRALMCYYTTGLTSRKDIRFSENDNDDYNLTVDRTLWLDVSLGRFKSKRLQLPRDTPTEYKNHMKTLVRAYKKDKQGNPIGMYVKGEKEHDHYAHARNYCEIALPFAASLMHHQNIENIL